MSEERDDRGDDGRVSGPERGSDQGWDGGKGSEAADADRRRRRAELLRELAEAKALRERVRPQHARAARLRRQLRMRSFRW
ncbi:hypothetical protein [Streptomyces sp. DW26H14]|uniref:hypothetical protein n=1 Tax=Streptomyces sp. DW26H14 TaxID=3435395 RepID=UPI00403DF756